MGLDFGCELLLAVKQFGQNGRVVATFKKHLYFNSALVRQNLDRFCEDIRDKCGRYCTDLHIAIDAAEGQVIDHVTEGRDVFSLGGIDLDGEDVVVCPVDVFC